MVVNRVVSGKDELGRGRLVANVANGRATIGPIEVEGQRRQPRGARSSTSRASATWSSRRAPRSIASITACSRGPSVPERSGRRVQPGFPSRRDGAAAVRRPGDRFRTLRLRGMAETSLTAGVRPVDGEPAVPAAADRRRQRIADELRGGPVRSRGRQAPVGATGDRHGQHAHRGRRQGRSRDERGKPPVRAASQGAAVLQSRDADRGQRNVRRITASACARPMRSARPRDGWLRRSWCRSSGSSASAFRATGATCARTPGGRPAHAAVRASRR